MSIELLAALRDLVLAARRVRDAMPHGPSEGYPECLPSFDEFTHELDVWLQSQIDNTFCPTCGEMPATECDCDHPCHTAPCALATLAGCD